MFYYKCNLEYEGGQIVYPFDIEKGQGFLYDESCTITFFMSEEELQDVEKITEDEYSSFMELVRDKPRIKEPTPEPEQDQALLDRIEALEMVLLSLLD